MARLDEPQELFFRNQLRAARARALANAEDFDDLLFAFERLGAFLGGPGKGLGDFREHLWGVAQFGDGTRAAFEEAFDAVKEGRNEAMHEGVAARNLAGRAMELALVLEAGLMKGKALVRHFMVDHPLCAEPWQQVRQARQLMLTNSFSALPIRYMGKWHLLTEEAVARYTRPGSRSQRTSCLHTIIDAAAADATHSLGLRRAAEVFPEQSIEALLDERGSSSFPFLVLEPSHNDRLLGILTAFDLL